MSDQVQELATRNGQTFGLVVKNGVRSIEEFLPGHPLYGGEGPVNCPLLQGEVSTATASDGHPILEPGQANEDLFAARGTWDGDAEPPIVAPL